MRQKEKIREFSRMSKGELQRSLQGLKEKLRQFRFELVAGKVKNIRGIRETKKDIARIMTLVREGELKAKPER